MKNLTFFFLIGFCITSCQNIEETNSESRTQIEIITTKGNILVELYNETPKHRDNFIKLVNEGFYNNILWHRVIDNFIIQTGDPSSKTAKPGEELGEKGIGYYVPAEIRDTIFHKRGTLSAAHDGNPEFDSDGSHFVIIQNDSISHDNFDGMEKWINDHLAIYHTYHADSNKLLLEAAKKAYVEEDKILIPQFEDSIKNISKTIETKNITHSLLNILRIIQNTVEHHSMIDCIPYLEKL